MATDVLGLPYGRPLTRADLESMPDDGHRYELIDGMLIVSAAPRPIHQRALANLYVVVREALPDELAVYFAPLAVGLADDTELQPDLIVAPEEDFTERDLPTAPLIAAEILSPSTRRSDLLLKKDRLRSAGCSHYWVIDTEGPSITAWDLVEGEYVEVGRASGDEMLVMERPFRLTVTPRLLLER